MIIWSLLALIAVLGTACGKSDVTRGDDSKSSLSGSIAIDGSSTVFPITEAMAEEFGKANRDVRVTVGISGTGGGFKKFCAKETAINDASRPIKDKEQAACKEAGVEYIELPVAFDGLSVMVNPKNDWVKEMTIEDLRKIWEPDAQGRITRWNQVRPEWPDRPLVLFGAGTDSGTYDYFTEAIVGEEGKSRGDFTGSEDDNVLVQGIAGEPNALGFFGYAYYEENASKLKLVPIVNPKNGKAVLPSAPTINDGSYSPLSRPLFIYVARGAAERPEVESFVKFYLTSPDLVASTGYVALPDSFYKTVQQRFANRIPGTLFTSEAPAGATLEERYRAANG